METENEIKDIKERLDKIEDRITNIESKFSEKPSIAKKEMSIRDFIILKKPKSNVNKTLAIGYFLENHLGYSSFTVKDIEEGYHLAKETVPKNVNLDVIRNIEKGYMMEAKEKSGKVKTWCLTNSGTNFVENNFEKKDK
ncbi:MAG: hypothetical protein JW984_12345 [Deltaproteobacteria bacterium]|uniref:Uncharacterized protein n=1 Tax=Candidatus Zymogenus saltonus TaxID=2844893 RepID=A0A9D8PR54_9DELT|nr:hypothetical protein [Candidatus Zymogenus saltonus]